MSTEEQKKSLFKKYPVYFIGGALVFTGTLFGLFIWKTRKLPAELKSHTVALDQNNADVGAGDGADVGAGAGAGAGA